MFTEEDPSTDPGLQINRLVSAVHALREEITRELYEARLVARARLAQERDVLSPQADPEYWRNKV
jgi:hypothetical protein